MKFFKFLGVGGVATAIQYGILILLVETGLAIAVVASTIGYIISGVLNYTLNYYYTFQSEAKHHSAVVKFIVVAAVGLGINSALVFLLTEVVSLYYLVAQIIATVAVLLWNFTAHLFWTYKSVDQTV